MPGQMTKIQTDGVRTCSCEDLGRIETSVRRMEPPLATCDFSLCQGWRNSEKADEGFPLRGVCRDDLEVAALVGEVRYVNLPEVLENEHSDTEKSDR